MYNLFFTRLISQTKHSLGLDRAIAFSIIGRGWTILSGLLSVTLISRYLTLDQQGFYYTFYSIVGIQILFELGLSFVILQLAAHERSAIELTDDGQILGSVKSLARLASILQKAIRWYSIAAALMAVTLLVAGFYFFASHGQGRTGWQLPWILLVLANSLIFQIDPVISFCEGCGKVSEVGRLRMTQGVVSSLLAWTTVISHKGLYAPFMVILGQGLMGAVFLYQHRKLLLPLIRFPTGCNAVSWRTEVWPFQWRIGVSSGCSYFVMQIMNPVVFRYCSPAEAGAMGMTLTVAGSLGALALSWMTTKAAPFGSLIARGEYAQLDQVFFRALKQSSIILMTGIVGLLLMLPLVFRVIPGFQSRVLPLPYLALCLAATVCNHVTVSEAYYLRAHKKEPFLYFWIVIAIASATTLIGAAKRWGLDGAVWGYFLCAGILRMASATYIFFKKRDEWHLQVPSEDRQLVESV